MKFVPYLFLPLVLLIMAVPAFAGGPLAASITSLTSDCTTVSVAWTISSWGGQNTHLSVTGSPNIDIVPDNAGGSMNVNIVDQADGTSITASITSGNGGAVVASQTITCAATAPVIEVVVNNLIEDGRLEPFSSNRVIYPENDGIKVYTPEGELVLFISSDTIDMIAVPDTGNRLLGETLDAYVRVFRLADGRFMALVGPDTEGKVHVVFWNGLGFATDLLTTTFNV